MPDHVNPVQYWTKFINTVVTSACVEGGSQWTRGAGREGDGCEDPEGIKTKSQMMFES